VKGCCIRSSQSMSVAGRYGIKSLCYLLLPAFKSHRWLQTLPCGLAARVPEARR
jgi:hypothetical protein